MAFELLTNCMTPALEKHFMFIRIPPGFYTQEVSCAGFGRLVQRGISLHKHAIIELALKMNFAADFHSRMLPAILATEDDDAK